MRETSREKLCSMTDTTEARILADDATVSCGLCGAKAHDASNVCDPVQLPEAGHFGD